MPSRARARLARPGGTRRSGENRVQDQGAATTRTRTKRAVAPTGPVSRARSVSRSLSLEITVAVDSVQVRRSEEASTM